MGDIVRVGAVACRAVVNAVEDNLAAAARWAEKAAAGRVGLLLFPELSLTGYGTRGEAPRPLGPDHAACREMAALARRLSLTLAAGMAWQDGPGTPEYLAHGLWLPSGEFFLYRKTHLGQRERREYAAGDVLPVFPLPGLKAGLQLCLEQHFPEITQTLALKGAQLILCPHATPRLAADDRRESWHISLRARAYDNCVYVLAANQAGGNGQGTVYHGGAMLVGPSGEVLAEDFSGEETLIAADIDLSRTAAARTTPQGMCRRFYALERRKELYC
ncbi:MAG TPA: nitrilase-related carbon-nitrogen hydrolase [Selenomonadales bacterium]|nr:nitrilase-related carbon-nitrogen hydrolase [Selenomonadales bacterium]